MGVVERESRLSKGHEQGYVVRAQRRASHLRLPVFGSITCFARLCSESKVERVRADDGIPRVRIP